MNITMNQDAGIALALCVFALCAAAVLITFAICDYKTKKLESEEVRDA